MSCLSQETMSLSIFDTKQSFSRSSSKNCCLYMYLQSIEAQLVHNLELKKKCQKDNYFLLHISHALCIGVEQCTRKHLPSNFPPNCRKGEQDQILEALCVCSAISVGILYSPSASKVSVLLCQVSHIPVVSVFKGCLRQNYYRSQQTESLPSSFIGMTWNNNSLED